MIISCHKNWDSCKTYRTQVEENFFSWEDLTQCYKVSNCVPGFTVVPLYVLLCFIPRLMKRPRCLSHIPSSVLSVTTVTHVATHNWIYRTYPCGVILLNELSAWESGSDTSWTHQTVEMMSPQSRGPCIHARNRSLLKCWQDEDNVRSCHNTAT